MYVDESVLAVRSSKGIFSRQDRDGQGGVVTRMGVRPVGVGVFADGLC